MARLSKIKFKSLSLMIIPIITLFSSCSDKNVADYSYEKTKNGLEYHFIKENKDAKTGEKGDIYTLNCEFITPDDSVVLSEELRFKRAFIRMRMDFQEALAMLHKGDSAIFRLPADTFYMQHGMRPNPAFKPSTDSTRGDMIYVRVGVKDIQDEVSYKIYKLNEEIDRINKFIERKKWNVTLDSNSGIRYEILNKGNSNKEIQLGDTTQLADLFWYTTEEDIIEKQRDNDTYQFVVGDQFNRVEGLSVLLTFLQEGDKVRAIIPYDLAFGENGFPPHVKPYATVCLEMEVASVQKKEKSLEDVQMKDSLQ